MRFSNPLFFNPSNTMNEMILNPTSKRDFKETVVSEVVVPVIDSAEEKLKRERMERIKMAMSSSARRRRREAVPAGL